MGGNQCVRWLAFGMIFYQTRQSSVNNKDQQKYIWSLMYTRFIIDMCCVGLLVFTWG